MFNFLNNKKAFRKGSKKRLIFTNFRNKYPCSFIPSCHTILFLWIMRLTIAPVKKRTIDILASHSINFLPSCRVKNISQRTAVWNLKMLINLHVNDYFCRPFSAQCTLFSFMKPFNVTILFHKRREKVIVICSWFHHYQRKRAPIIVDFLGFQIHIVIILRACNKCKDGMPIK